MMDQAGLLGPPKMVTAAVPAADSLGGRLMKSATFSVVAKCGQSVTESPSPAYTEIYRSIRHRAEGSALVFRYVEKAPH
jgi:hypothetical protein